MSANRVLFDGDCGICSYASELLERMDRRRLFKIEPYQSVPDDELRQIGLTRGECRKRLQVVSREGRVYAGASGINFFLWRHFPWSLAVVLIYAVPVLLLLEVIGYAVVARNRQRISRWLGIDACAR